MQTSAKKHPGTTSSAPATTVPTRIRHLYRLDRARPSAQAYEQGLLNLVRKLSWPERLEVAVYAERLALARIDARLQRRRRGGRHD